MKLNENIRRLYTYILKYEYPVSHVLNHKFGNTSMCTVVFEYPNLIQIHFVGSHKGRVKS